MKQLNQYLNYLILILVVGYVGFYFFTRRHHLEQKEEKSVTATVPVNVDQVVNKYMQETAVKNDVLMAATKTAVKKELVKARKLNNQVENQIETQIPIEQQIWKEQPVQGGYQSLSPNDEINQRIQNQELKKAEEEAYKQEYARQYIENARKNGYHIILDENLNVIKATPIRRPSDEDTVESYPAD